MKKKTLFEEAGYDEYTRFVVTRDIPGGPFKKGDVIRSLCCGPLFSCNTTRKSSFLDFQQRLNKGDIQVINTWRLDKSDTEQQKTLFEVAGYDKNTRFVVTKDIQGVHCDIAFKKGDVIRYISEKGKCIKFVCDKTGKEYLLYFEWRIGNGDIRVIDKWGFDKSYKSDVSVEYDPLFYDVDFNTEQRKTKFEKAGYDKNTRFVVTRDILEISESAFSITLEKGDVIRFLYGNDKCPVFACKTIKKSNYLRLDNGDYLFRLDFQHRLDNGDIQEEEIYKRRLEMQKKKKQDFWYIGNGQVTFKEPVKNKMVKDDAIPEAPDFTSKKHLWDF